MKHGLIVGKFYPPHKGHHHLIQTAVDECDHVTVAVCYSSVENISVLNRINWLRDTLNISELDKMNGAADVGFYGVKDDSPVEYTDETWGLFLTALWNQCLKFEEIIPDTIYTGENYGPEFATRLKKFIGEQSPWLKSKMENFEFQIRKLDRKELGFCATDFRNNPVNFWEQLAPATKAGMCKRVVICGAESTGTTTLAKALGAHYETPVVPEYGRHFDWAVGKHHTWTNEDFVHIAQKQNEWENDFARMSEGGLLICDTDDYATAMFSKVYLGKRTPSILENATNSPADLYIITDDRGIPFEDDGTRFNSGKREWMTDWFSANLPTDRTVIVTGPHETRMEDAIDRINNILKWHIEAPMEYRKVDK